MKRDYIPPIPFFSLFLIHFLSTSYLSLTIVTLIVLLICILYNLVTYTEEETYNFTGVYVNFNRIEGVKIERLIRYFHVV